MTRVRLRQWLLWGGLLALTTALMLTVRTELDKAHVALAFLLVVLAGSSAAGRTLGIALAAAAFLVFNFFFLPPYNTLVIANPLDWLVLFAFLVTGVTAAQLLENQRREARIARERAEEIDRLATLGAETLNAPRAEEALDAIASVIRERMGTEGCEIFLWQQGNGGGLRLAGGTPIGAVAPSESDLLAYTVEHHSAAAMRSDGTLTLIGDALAAATPDVPNPLANLRALGIPLSVRGRIVGALRLSSPVSFTLSDDQRRVLGALSYYAALGVERVRLGETEEEAETLRRADRLKDALLASVSHDLRTPLTAIKGIANEIWRGGDPDRAATIEQEADRLNKIVTDLLDLSLLNAGNLPLTIALNTADDVVGVALERVEALDGSGRIQVQVENEGGILVGLFDFAHTTRTLTNLLENALKYSPAGAPITLRAWRGDDRVRFTVEDAGPGVTPGEEERVFEPFYRGVRIADGVRGTGLGLSIARQLAEAQRGSLTYRAREGGGSRFELELPAGEAPAD
ncbi:MAG TPA: ATP-binding protein [Gemmatimonadaceae bacterium]